MPSHRSAPAAGIVSVVFAAAQVLYLYDPLHAFSPDHACAIALLAFPCLAALNYPLIRLALAPILEARYGLAALIVGLVVAVAATPGERFASAGISVADGSTFSAEHKRARRTAFWAFHLHPEFDNQKPVHRIGVPVPLLASAVLLRVAQPDSSRGLGDGVELHVDVQNGDAATSRALPPWQILPGQLPPKAWLTRKLPLHPGDRNIIVDVLSGPPGSTAAYDATYVAVAFSGIGPRLANFGRLTLALAVVGALGALFWQSRRLLTHREAHGLRNAWGAAVDPRTIAFVAILLSYTAAFYALDRTIVFYDPLNYFFKTENVAEAFRRLALGRIAGDVTGSSLDEYTLWPALIPGLIASFVSWSLVAYALVITLVYMAPAALMCSVLDSRLLRSKADQTHLVLGALSVCLALPHFYRVALAPMPDVGGVIIACLFILVVSALCERLTLSGPDSSADANSQRPLVLYAMTAAILLIALFLFRRWYIFLGAGVVLSALLVLAKSWKSLSLKRCWLVASVAALTLLLLLGGVISHWLQTPDKRDYAKLYAGYAWPLSDVAEDALKAFGWVVPLTALIICVVIGFRTRRPLPFILVLSAFAGATLMLQVQSPGAHHFYILMPFLGGAISAGTILLARRIGSPATLALLLVFALLVIPQAKKHLRSAHVFPPSAFPQPRARNDLPELTRLAYWLVENIRPGEQYCAVGSGGAFSPSLVDNVWQLAPALRKKMPATGTMPEVDSRDGPPKESLKDCTVMLVADPIQISLAPDQQQGVVAIAQAILKGENVGAAYAIQPDEFKLAKGVVVRVYRRTRPVTDDEFKELIAIYSAATAAKRR